AAGGGGAMDAARARRSSLPSSPSSSASSLGGGTVDGRTSAESAASPASSMSALSLFGAGFGCFFFALLSDLLTSDLGGSSSRGGVGTTTPPDWRARDRDAERSSCHWPGFDERRPAILGRGINQAPAPAVRKS